MCQVVPFAGFILSLFYQYSWITEVLFSFEFDVLRAQAMLVHSLPMKSRERLVHDVMPYNSAIHAGLVHDVTDTDCMTQNGSAHGPVFATFKLFFFFF